MKQLLRICLTGAFFLLFEGLLSPMLAGNGKSDKEILVLNSINFNLPWAKNFYDAKFRCQFMLYDLISRLHILMS